MKFSRKLLAFLVGWLCAVAIATPVQRTLSGSYILGGKTAIDAPKSTHLQLLITGSAAKDLYRAMSAKPVKYQGFMDGSITKFIGGTACAKHANGIEFSCSLSINLKSQREESTYVC